MPVEAIVGTEIPSRETMLAEAVEVSSSLLAHAKVPEGSPETTCGQTENNGIIHVTGLDKSNLDLDGPSSWPTSIHYTGLSFQTAEGVRLVMQKEFESYYLRNAKEVEKARRAYDNTESEKKQKLTAADGSTSTDSTSGHRYAHNLRRLGPSILKATATTDDDTIIANADATAADANVESNAAAVTFNPVATNSGFPPCIVPWGLPLPAWAPGKTWNRDVDETPVKGCGGGRGGYLIRGLFSPERERECFLDKRKKTKLADVYNKRRENVDFISVPKRGGNTPYMYTAAAAEDTQISAIFTAGGDGDNMSTKIPAPRKRANAVSIPK
ncbi:hypothetical protein K440DRAFT_668625 [Wilcoxina mikolae CBS 423.85]|nr:hypothetical protein K440DRAFT_668625 [Wilcoxina mikolae CBS 423.85]